jgi:hypothetical protein
MNRKVFAIIISAFLAIGSITCFNDSKSDTSQSRPSLRWLGQLPSPPSDPQLNDAYYSTAANESYIWDGNTWNLLISHGADNVILNWRGMFPSTPASPVANDAYFNTTDKNSYIYNGTTSTWDILASKGSPTSPVTWYGSYNNIAAFQAANPGHPIIYDAYHDITFKQSYMYDGASWLTIAIDGTPGADGTSVL